MSDDVAVGCSPFVARSWYPLRKLDFPGSGCVGGSTWLRSAEALSVRGCCDLLRVACVAGLLTR